MDTTNPHTVRAVQWYMILVTVLCLIGGVPQALSLNQVLSNANESMSELEKTGEAFASAVKLHCNYRWMNCKQKVSTWGQPGKYTPMRPVEAFLCDYCK